jgi:hypothetical protein
MNGEPRFGFKLKITSHEDEVLTLNWYQTALKEMHSFDEIATITDEQGQKPQWGCAFGCWEQDIDFPMDGFFEEIHPGVPYEEMFWLDREDPKTSQGGELEDIEAGKEYKVQVSEGLRLALSGWKRGTKEELLAGGLKEKKARWKNYGKLILDVSEPFTFKTV